MTTSDAMPLEHFIQAVQTSDFTTNGGWLQNCLTFDGFVGRIEYRF